MVRRTIALLSTAALGLVLLLVLTRNDGRFVDVRLGSSHAVAAHAQFGVLGLWWAECEGAACRLALHHDREFPSIRVVSEGSGGWLFFERMSSPQVSSATGAAMLIPMWRQRWKFSRHETAGARLTFVRMRFWMLIVVASAYPVLAFVRGPCRRWHRRRRGLCVKCGYNLTGLPEPRCPECGRNFG